MIGVEENDSQMQIRRWQIHLLVLAAYVLFALALTWPVVARLDTEVPGNGIDDPPLTWNLWWVQDALLRQGANPFDSDYIFYPLGINLAFYTLTVLNGFLSIPVQATGGLIPASNLVLLSSFVLSGYGAFLLAGYVLSKNQGTPRMKGPGMAGSSLLPSFGAGLLYAFASSKLAYAALGQWNIASSQWIPFYILCLLFMVEHPRRWRYPLLAALFLLLQAYAELTYASFLVLFTALWAVWQLITRVQPGDNARRISNLAGLVGNLALVGIIFIVGLAPVLAMMIPDMMVEGDIFVEKGGFAGAFSADLVGFLVPAMHHPLLGSLVERFEFDHGVGQHLYLGYSVLALAALGALWAWRRTAAARFWTLSTALFWLMTLGPSLRINGHDTGIPLPFALVAQLPFFKGNRYPSRYSVLFVLSLSMLVAFGLTAIIKRRAKPSRPSASAMVLLALVLFEHLAIPLPMTDMEVPSVYQTIADEMPGDSTLLDLPVAWRNGFRVTGTQHPIIMFQQYYQTVHGKRILAGNTSRNPPLTFQYFTEAPVINTIIALETGHQVDAGVAERDRELAAAVLRFFNIQTILIHPEQTGPEMAPYVEATMPVHCTGAGGDLLLCRVDLAPWPERWVIEPGDELSRLSYAEGWGVPANGILWAQRKAVRLLAPLNGAEQAMTFRAYAPSGGQQLRLELNGQRVAELDLGDGWHDYEVSLPARTVREGLNEVWLRFGSRSPASGARLSDRSIGQTGVRSPVNLVVTSAGQEVGDFGQIYIDGRDVSPDERGYNVVVIHPETGQVEHSAAFDTHLDASASEALAAFLDTVPDGRIIAVAAADEASRLLGAGAVEALRRIGAIGDLRDRFRWGHAIIGVQGAAAGTALEEIGWMRPVTVIAGEGATEPELAAAFGEIGFRAGPGD